MQIKKNSEISDQEYENYSGTILHVNGDKAYLLDGQLHRTDGPAVERSDGYKAWYLHGKLHRIDGPAVERTDGSKSWCYQGNYINVNSQEEFESWLVVRAFE